MRGFSARRLTLEEINGLRSASSSFSERPAAYLGPSNKIKKIDTTAMLATISAALSRCRNLAYIVFYPVEISAVSATSQNDCCANNDLPQAKSWGTRRA